MRSGMSYTIGALVMVVVSAVAIATTASESRLVVTQLTAIGVLIFILYLLLGSARWLAFSSVPMVLAIVLEAGFGDNPSWVRSIVVGCLWFVTIELGWEAIDRRDGASRTVAATARRAQEVATVVVIALMVGLVAAAASSFAPVRSVLLQAIVLGSLLAGLVTIVRRLSPLPPESR